MAAISERFRGRGSRDVRGPRGAAKAAPRVIPDPPRRILLASTGVAFSRDAIERAVDLATPEHAKITVLSIARVFGTSLGFPNPGLQPNRLEIAEQHTIIEDAAAILRQKGFEVRVAMSKSRNAPKMIARWGNAKNFHAIVVCDPARAAWRRKIEGDVAREIRRRCPVPVYAIPT
jgi:nucleotide-binding universal stress UspA family protein